MKKRFMAMLLTVAMVLGMMATPASAASSLQEAMSEVNIYARNTDLVWLTMNGSVKTQWYTYYNFTSASGETKEIPAYCVDPRLYGVPAKVPEGTAIKYSATETITDPKVMGIISNGYPHMTFADLGVNSIEEAYYATKTALWCYLLGNWNVSGLGINPALTGADKEAAQCVLQATKAIYQRGMRWTSIPTPKLSATPDTSSAVAATIKGADCYAQTFTVTTGTWSLEPVLISLAEGAPSGAKITDMDGDEISSLNVNDAEYGSDGYSWKVKVVYPKSSIEGESGTAKIVLRSTVVQYELYFAKTLEADKYGNMENRKREKYTWVFIDECYLYFKYHYSGEFLYRAWKRFRKYAGIMTAATQNVEECLKSETARLMLANSEFLLLFNQSATDRAELSKLLHISDTQMGYVTNADPGHGLLRFGGSLVPFSNTIPRETELYRLMSTTPGEN